MGNYVALKLKKINIKVNFTFLCVGGNFNKLKSCSNFWDVLHSVVMTFCFEKYWGAHSALPTSLHCNHTGVCELPFDFLLPFTFCWHWWILSTLNLRFWCADKNNDQRMLHGRLREGKLLLEWVFCLPSTPFIISTSVIRYWRREATSPPWSESALRACYSRTGWFVLCFFYSTEINWI